MNPILFLEHTSNFGGGQTILLELLNAAVKQYNHCTVAFPFGGELERRLGEKESEDVDTVRLYQMQLKNGNKTLFDLFKLIINSFVFLFYLPLLVRHRLWYLNGARLLVPIVIPALILRKKTILHIHLDHSFLEKKLIVMLMRVGVLHRIICCSSFVKERLIESGLEASLHSKCLVIENCLPIWCDDLPFFDRITNSDPEKINVAIIGSISRNKGQEIAIQLARDIPMLNFYIIGNVLPGEEAYADLLYSKTSSQLRFCGPTNNVLSSLNELGIQVVIVPTRRTEAFGLVAIEAMACSCMTFVARVGGLIDICSSTGAIGFNSYVELMAFLNNWGKLSSAEKVFKVKEQHRRCQDTYSRSKFHSSIQKVFAEIAPG